MGNPGLGVWRLLYHIMNLGRAGLDLCGNRTPKHCLGTMNLFTPRENRTGLSIFRNQQGEHHLPSSAKANSCAFKIRIVSPRAEVSMSWSVGENSSKYSPNCSK